MRRVRVPEVRAHRGVVVLIVLAGLLAGTSPALAQPTPPPNPSDDELRRSQEAVQQQAGEQPNQQQRLPANFG